MRKKVSKGFVWKLVAICFIVIFAIFIVFGLIRAYHSKSSFVIPSQDQKDLALKVATEKFVSSGGNLSDFKVIVSDRMHKSHDGKSDILQVSLYNNVINHVYIVDVDTGALLLHSETETFDGFKESTTGFRHEGPMPISFFSKIFENNSWGKE
jgi:hypothetical protein